MTAFMESVTDDISHGRGPFWIMEPKEDCDIWKDGVIDRKVLPFLWVNSSIKEEE